MTAATMLLAALLAQADPNPTDNPNPASDPPVASPGEIVDRLGSPRYADREQATEDLLNLGAPALGPLANARHHRDPEVRARAAALLDRIQGQLMVRPTLVPLDFRDRPLLEVVHEISERSGIRIGLQPDNNGFWANDRVTLQSPEPVPFWTALDRLCDHSQLIQQSNFRGHQPQAQFPSIELARGDTNHIPRSISGPIRIELSALNLNRTITFRDIPRFGAPRNPAPVRIINPPPAGASNGYFNAQFVIMAEPRLLIGQGAPIHWLEALDDQGRSLIPPATTNTATLTHRVTNMSQGVGPIPLLQVQGPLNDVNPRAERIATLKGTIPIEVATRRPDPLVVPLVDAPGKSFRSDAVTLTIHELKPDPNGQGTLIDLTILPTPSTTRPSPDTEPLTMALLRNSQNQLEALDAQGQTLIQFPRPAPNQVEGRLNLIIPPPPANPGPPTQLRYYDLTRATTEASFEFHDIPMP